MNALAIPDQLRGPWEHAVFLTYGADLPFFERAIRVELPARCRNVVILADGAAFRDSCAGYARGEAVRQLNQQYLADGIECQHAAHAKLILLAGPDEGRLLVGSGNLGLQGYASGGELFTRYDYGPDHPGALAAFLAARELLDWLIEGRAIAPPAARRLQYLSERVPWLFATPAGDARPVRHNLEHSFIQQLREEVGPSPVEELWALAPFYDEDAAALEQLLATFRPQRVTVLVQPGRTSADTAALARAVAAVPVESAIRPIRKGDDNPYVHAKFYLLKLADRAVCLQGSPNLSRVALLRTPPAGNIELANLLSGPRDAFDAVLEALAIGPPVADLAGLALHYEPPEGAAQADGPEWYLTGGEWHGPQLQLFRRGPWPPLAGAALVIDGQPFALDVLHEAPTALTVALPPGAAALLQRPVATLVRWGDDDTGATSNPIFVANRAALTAALDVPEESPTLARAGDLDLNDEEIEQLLGDLNAALLIDRRSAWQLTGRTPPEGGTGDEDEAYRLDYADIDCEALRRHPKIQQYLQLGAGGQSYGRSRLQTILAAITDHFHGLIEPRVLDVPAADLAEENSVEVSDEDEAEVSAPSRRWTLSQRRQRLLENFIRRYLRGVRSPDFQRLAGYETMAHNYVIFAHILWRLYAKGWVEDDFILDALLETWQLFWGDDRQRGYFRLLDDDERDRVRQWVRAYHADAELLAALYYGERLAGSERWEARRFGLRDFARVFFARPPFPLAEEVPAEAVVLLAALLPYDPPDTAAIAWDLIGLTRFDTRPRFLRDMERRYDLTPGRSTFVQHDVVVRAQRRKVSCLTLQGRRALEDSEMAIAIFQAWRRFEQLDYYRIDAPAQRRLFFYDIVGQEGTYWARDRGEKPQETGPLPEESPAWEQALMTIGTTATVSVESGDSVSARRPAS